MLTQTAEGLPSTINDQGEETQSQITQLSTNINARVQKGDVINQINISTEDILISGKKLILDGDTTVTGTFRVKNANISSVDAGKLTVGELTGHSLVGGSVIGGYIEQQSGSRRLEMSNGQIDSLYNGRFAMRFGQFSLEFYNQCANRIGRFGPTTFTGSDSQGLTLSVDQDYISIAHLKDGVYQPSFRTQDILNNRSTFVAGPYASNDLNQSTMLTLYANSRVATSTPRSTNQAVIRLEQTPSLNNILMYYGSTTRPNSEFELRRNIDSTASALVMQATSSRVTIQPTLYFGTGNSRVGTGTNHVSWHYDVNNRIRQMESGNIDYFMGNNVRHSFSANGNAEFTGELKMNGRLLAPSAYDNTTSNAVNLHIFSGTGRLARSTSARKYKKDIQLASDVDYKKILELDVKSWLDKGEVERNNGSTVGLKLNYGLIANGFEDLGLQQMVVYENEEIENYSDRAWTLLIPNINDLKKEVESLTFQNEKFITSTIKAIRNLDAKIDLTQEKLVLKIAELERRLNILKVVA